MKKYGEATGKSIQSLHIALLTLLLCILSAALCKAQLNPFQAMYYQNRYMANPAMAGLDKGLNINLGYLQQWDTFPGSPKTQSFIAEYQATDKVGLGLNLNDNQEGIFRQDRVMGTYAYHLPVGGENQKLNLGLSLGINDPRLNYAAISGDLTDIELQKYNQQSPYFDGDLGLAYTSNNLFVGATLPNLGVNVFNRGGQRQDVDRTVFFTEVSYKIDLSNPTGAFSLEPLAAYRKIKGFTNIFDAGLNFKMNDYYLDLQAIYHSNDNIGFGFVFNQPTYALNFAYDVNRGQISNYANGTFEIGLKLKLFK